MKPEPGRVERIGAEWLARVLAVACPVCRALPGEPRDWWPFTAVLPHPARIDAAGNGNDPGQRVEP